MDKVAQGAKQFAVDGPGGLEPLRVVGSIAFTGGEGRRQVLTAVYWDCERAERTLVELEQAGFSSSELKVVLADKQKLAVEPTAAEPQKCATLRRLHEGSDLYASPQGLRTVLLESGIPEAEVRELERALLTGGILVMICADTRAAKALQILQRRHGVLVLGPATLLDALIATASRALDTDEQEPECLSVRREHKRYRKFVL